MSTTVSHFEDTPAEAVNGCNGADQPAQAKAAALAVAFRRNRRRVEENSGELGNVRWANMLTRLGQEHDGREIRGQDERGGRCIERGLMHQRSFIGGPGAAVNSRGCSSGANERFERECVDLPDRLVPNWRNQVRRTAFAMRSAACSPLWMASGRPTPW